MIRSLLGLGLLIGCIPANLAALQKSVDQQTAPKGTEAAFSHFDPQSAVFDLGNAYLSAVALQAASGDLDMLTRGGFQHVVQVDGEQTGDKAVIAANQDLLLILFRAEREDVATLWDDLQEGFSDGDGWGCEGCRIQVGGVEAINDLWGNLTETLNKWRRPGQAVWLSGHGLGGSLAVLAAFRLAKDGVPVQGVYTFGQPRVGDTRFSQRYADGLGLAKDGSPLYRIVYESDIVPRLKPPYIKSARMVTNTLSPYVHFGSMIYLGGDGAISVNPGLLQDLDASRFALREHQNHQLATYLTLLSDNLGEEDGNLINESVTTIRGLQR